MTTVLLEATTDEAFELSPEATSVTSKEQSRRIPLTMPSAQEYYWHFEWQHGERETLDGLASGEYVEFNSDDPEDAARWLREPDDE